MAKDSIEWTSFRTLEPNPHPYTPMTQSILERGVKTSSLVAAIDWDTSPVTFHRGYLYFNVTELRRQLSSFIDIPNDVLIDYFRDEADIDFDRISVRPSLSGIVQSLRMAAQSDRVLFRGLTIKHRLPDRPSIKTLDDGELLSLLDTHQAFLTEMVGAHVLFSALAEGYAIGIERYVPGGPSRQRVQNLISGWTRSKTSKMARWASRLETDDQRDEFLQVFGHRCPREMEIAVPRWRDDPSTLRTMPSHSRSPAANTDSMGKLKTTLARVTLYPGSLLERLRENPKNEWLKSYAYLRDALVEVGRRATKSGHLAVPENIFYLTLRTARQLLDDPPSRSHTHNSISCAECEHERNKSYSPPLFLNEGFQPVKQKQMEKSDGIVRGLGVSGGQISGRAITARSPKEVDLSGEVEPRILVTEFTDAGWTPFFFQVDGLVMERGSLLSHGSIVAREAGIPAVVNADNVLEHINTGDRISLDADNGIVRLPDA